jgi:hypothetical protein
VRVMPALQAASSHYPANDPMLLLSSSAGKLRLATVRRGAPAHEKADPGQNAQAEDGPILKNVFSIRLFLFAHGRQQQQAGRNQ